MSINLNIRPVLNPQQIAELESMHIMKSADDLSIITGGQEEITKSLSEEPQQTVALVRTAVLHLSRILIGVKHVMSWDLWQRAVYEIDAKAKSHAGQPDELEWKLAAENLWHLFNAIQQAHLNAAKLARKESEELERAKREN